MKLRFPIFLVLASSAILSVRGALPDPAPAEAPVAASPAPPPSAPAKRSAAELEKLAMPIALHPDPLIAAILPAAVYPVEIVQAARFVKDTNNIPKVDEQPWDDNVKTVAKFPQLIAQMDGDLAWTVALGQAFLDQRKELMDTIQALRGKAQTAGTLRTTPQQIVTVTNTVVERVVEQQTVVVTNTVVQIQPSNPQVVYVPSYPPTVYYPPPAYVYDPYAPLISFGLGMAAGAIIANNWNHCDWHGGDVDIDVNNANINRNNNYNRNSNVNRGQASQRSGGTQKWQPDQNRLRSSGAAPSARTSEARGWGGSGGQTGQRSGAGGARPSQQPASGRSPGMSASTQPARSGGAGPSASPASRQSSGASRPAPSASASRPSSNSSAFSGVNSGSSARSSSNRGASSMGGGGRSGGGGRGGGGRGGGGRR